MDIATIVLSISGIAGGAGTVAYAMETRFGRAKKRRDADTQAIVDNSITPMQTAFTELKTQVQADGSHIATVIKLALYEALDPIKIDISTLKANDGAIFKSLEQVSVAIAELMHKPHPENAELDQLLEDFVDWVQGNGLFPPEEEKKLRKYLLAMKNWKPGQDVGFVVDPGDPTRAGILLATMELTRIRHNQEQS